MSGGGGGNSNNPNKIKGGRWTVIRFFFVSVAYTFGWMSISSLLGHYKLRYGPQILLEMNIAYFLPSIPLLVVSSFLDDFLDRKLEAERLQAKDMKMVRGVAKTVLGRLLFGLGGCAIICAIFPFVHSSARALLVVVTVLGVVSGVAFSASYQLVARFANKNTISLGLGCVGSGVFALIIEIGLRMGPSPTRRQELWLFELTAGFVVLGFLAAISLLLRHWRSIEATTPAPASEDATQQPLLQEDGTAEVSVHSPERSRTLSRRISLSMLLKHSPLDLLENVPDQAGDIDEDTLLAVRSLFRQTSLSRKDVESSSMHARHSLDFSGRHSLDFSGRHSLDYSGRGIDRSVRPVLAEDEALPAYRPDGEVLPSGASPVAGRSAFADSDEGFREACGAPGIGIGELVGMVWPVMLALFLAGANFIIVFPFFTYIPSSGIFGDDLPKVLFFERLFMDLAGRTLPRVKRFALTSQRLLLVLALLKTATIPLFFLYLKAPASYRSDYLALGYIAFLWGILGYVNTCAYMLAPQRVPSSAKGAVNGALAIIYQGSHCIGLVIATLLAVSMFGALPV